jgi:(p)ppGpp synthase/HD superfamily hydrolase
MKKTRRKNVETARDLARLAHAGQTRKNGEPYFNHPERVAQQISRPAEQAVAYLHDVLEDCEDPVMLEELNGFPELILTAVKLLTRAPCETYFDFIHRVLASGNQIAIAVKMADLKDNLRDLEEGHQKDKYRFALELLEGGKTPNSGGSLEPNTAPTRDNPCQSAPKSCGPTSISTRLALKKH